LISRALVLDPNFANAHDEQARTFVIQTAFLSFNCTSGLEKPRDLAQRRLWAQTGHGGIGRKRNCGFRAITNESGHSDEGNDVIGAPRLTRRFRPLHLANAPTAYSRLFGLPLFTLGVTRACAIPACWPAFAPAWGFSRLSRPETRQHALCASAAGAAPAHVCANRAWARAAPHGRDPEAGGDSGDRHLQTRWCRRGAHPRAPQSPALRTINVLTARDIGGRLTSKIETAQPYRPDCVQFRRERIRALLGSSQANKRATRSSSVDHVAVRC
jgi:hypothetical protein